MTVLSRSHFFLRLSYPCLPSATARITDSVIMHLAAHEREVDRAAVEAMLAAPLAEGFAASAQAVLLLEIENDAIEPHRIRFNARPQLADAYTHPTAAEVTASSAGPAAECRRRPR